MIKKGLMIAIISTIVHWYLNTSDFPTDGALNRKVLITGASSGIGEHLAYQYAKHGASVFITARREDRLKKIIHKCQELGMPDARFGYYVADMKDFVIQSKLFIKAGAEFLGGVDSLVLNHALLPRESIFWFGSSSDLQVFEETTQVNYHSYVHLASHSLPYLKQSRNGRLGVVGSVIGKVPLIAHTVYCGTKFALDGFFSSLRLELHQSNSGVTITHGVIGAVDTEMQTNRMNKMENLNVSFINKLEAIVKVTLESAENVAYNMMVATELGEHELYYPPRVPYMPVYAKWIVIWRSMFPALTTMHYPYEVYQAYENKIKTM